VSELDLKKLSKLIALCRKTGVESLRVGDIELTLGSAPLKKESRIDHQGLNASRSPFDPGVIPPPQAIPAIKESEEIPTDALTEEQLMFYSAVPNSEPTESIN
jgi:hypothetical protein